MYARSINECLLERKTFVDTDRKAAVEMVERSDFVKRSEQISNTNEICDVKCNELNRNKVLGQLQKILRKDRNEDWEDDSDFEINEYDYFVSVEKSEDGPGSFEEFGHIPDEKINEVKLGVMKERHAVSESGLNSILVQKFYGDPGSFDLKLSFKLNQCIRSGSDYFEEAKDYLLNEGFDIWSNEFF